MLLESLKQINKALIVNTHTSFTVLNWGTNLTSVESLMCIKVFVSVHLPKKATPLSF